jgi:transposase
MKRTSKLPLTLLPETPGLRLEDTFIDADTVSLTLASTSLPAACPVCGAATARLHSHYRRTVADLPWSGRRVKLLLRVRKFRCPEAGCPRRKEGAPGVVEVLDRWHLLKNLREAAERVLERNHKAISTVTLPSSADRDPCPIGEHTPVPRSAKERGAGEAERRKRLASYEKVKKLHEKGMSMLAICRYLGMSRGPYAATSTPTSSRSAVAGRVNPACSIPSSRTLRRDGRRAAATRCGCGER